MGAAEERKLGFQFSEQGGKAFGVVAKQQGQPLPGADKKVEILAAALESAT